MLGQLRKPPQHFEHLIQSHFYYKRAAINKMLDQWLADAQHASSSKGHHAKLLKVVKDLRYVIHIYNSLSANTIYSDEFAKLQTPA